MSNQPTKSIAESVNSSIITLKARLSSAEFQKQHIQHINSCAGVRYSPQLNVDLPIVEVFEGISRSPKFYREIRENLKKLHDLSAEIKANDLEEEIQISINELNRAIRSALVLLDTVKRYSSTFLPWARINALFSDLDDKLWILNEKLREGGKSETNKCEVENAVANASRINERRQYLIYDLNRLHTEIRYMKNYTEGNKVKLSNNRFLIIEGKAGTGKTHLLCDIAVKRVQNGLPTVTTFGENFTGTKDFWEELFVQLKIDDLNPTPKIFLTALDELAETAECRALIIVDALNENILRAPGFWKSNLEQIKKTLNPYKNIGLIVSLRTGFEDQVLEKSLRDEFVRVEHEGFSDNEWDAVERYFNAFELPLPEIPVLLSEFQNPLFLQLFCTTFSKKTRTLRMKSGSELKSFKKPASKYKGFQGATHIFEKFVLSASTAIVKQFGIEKANFSTPEIRVWSQIIKGIAKLMVLRRDDRIKTGDLIKIVRKTIPEVNATDFIQSLEKNMLITIIPNFLVKGNSKNADIRFPFQKFSDHLIGRYIFEEFENKFGKGNLSLENAKKYFSLRTKIGRYISDGWNLGILESISVRCPEHLKGLELVQVAPYLLKDERYRHLAISAFIESLIWRDHKKAFSGDLSYTCKTINKYVLTDVLLSEDFLDAIISVSTVPDHPFNAKGLHKYLLSMDLGFRDSFWSVFLHKEYGNKGAVDRLLKWSLRATPKSVYKDDSILLGCIALSWFLSSSNRFIRDKATKGLVSQLQQKLYLLPELLEKFLKVNDPYIQERLYAVAYGCALRNTEDKVNLEVLARWVYNNNFVSRNPPTHILCRDYARGIIEICHKREIALDISKDKTEPPYRSDWPDYIPSEDELRAKTEKLKKECTGAEHFGLTAIWNSVMGSGDFARYVIGTNWGQARWSGRRLGAGIKNRHKQLHDFKQQLNQEQLELLWQATFQLPDFNDQKGETIPVSIVFESGDEARKECEWNDFEKSLDNRQLTYFLTEIKPFYRADGRFFDPLDNFDLKIAQRWIFNRVLELGYSSQLHGDFDSYQLRYNGYDHRTNHKAERIGKKYQWIAFHEFLGLLADHYELKSDWSDITETKYLGPWEPSVRDIDPSLLIRDDTKLNCTINIDKWYATKANYNSWRFDINHESWLRVVQDIPNPMALITLDDESSKQWLQLQGYFEWKNPIPDRLSDSFNIQRELWYIFKSFIIKKQDLKDFLLWANNHANLGHSLPSSHQFTSIFLREYPESLAFESLRGTDNEWTTEYDYEEDLPVPLIVTDDAYLNEHTIDCSSDDSIEIKLPCKWLIQNLKLKHCQYDGMFYDYTGKIVVCPTAIFDNNRPNLLLIDKTTLLVFLNNNGYSIIWSLIGEKITYSDDMQSVNQGGIMNLSGLYYLDENGQIIGTYQAEFTE